MYSMVLMAALTTGGATPDCHFRGGCHGCSGCYGGGCHGWHGGCWGSGYGACYGTCYGGYGAGVYGGWGGCYGYAGWGCWGSGYGCYGSGAGCWGAGYGCYGAGYGGCMGNPLSPYAVWGTGGAVMPGTLMPPATGSGTGTGTGTGGTGTGGEVLPKPKPDKDKNGTSLAPNRARLIVELPADAKLYIDDQVMKTTSGRRTFHTPTLDRTQTYYYILRAETVRDGKPVSETRRVILRAGDVVRTDFTGLGDSTATASAR